MLVLIFRVSESRYAIPCRRIIEVIPLVTLRPVTQAPAWICGSFVFRGTLTPVIDLCQLIGGYPCPLRLSSRVILTDCAQPNGHDIKMGLLAEHVTEARHVSAKPLAGESLGSTPYKRRKTCFRCCTPTVSCSAPAAAWRNFSCTEGSRPVKRIEQLLSREIGLMARSIGSGAIEAAVRGRMASCRLATVDEYLERLEQNASERSALVEDIVVSETWFFRDESVFEDLAAFASGPWRKANPEGILRVLCVPCATGEEPYSAAIVLLEAGLPAARFQVLGVELMRPCTTNGLSA
jgi:hypothetical protein